jgi:S-adenosyl-L-methionine hydrolase (adenosine-forming)
MRRPIAVKTSEHFFVGPDNGLFSFALAGQKSITVRSIDSKTLMLPVISTVFHGRDVFAPVSAHLAEGTPFETVGREIPSFTKLEWEKPIIKSDYIKGKVVHIDRFGNAITNISALDIASTRTTHTHVVLSTRPSGPIRLCDYYQQVAPNSPLALVDSSGFLEIAVNGGSAAEFLRILTGDEIELRS